mmetsp:Transcript_53260/g.114418  ORF Transcript_53260/g.114418 Transcript_53260/m.114418 type:complete len:523 (-) Transcript_53260:2039-3607(-)
MLRSDGRNLTPRVQGAEDVDPCPSQCVTERDAASQILQLEGRPSYKLVRKHGSLCIPLVAGWQVAPGELGETRAVRRAARIIHRGLLLELRDVLFTCRSEVHGAIRVGKQARKRLHGAVGIPLRGSGGLQEGYFRDAHRELKVLVCDDVPQGLRQGKHQLRIAEGAGLHEADIGRASERGGNVLHAHVLEGYGLKRVEKRPRLFHCPTSRAREEGVEALHRKLARLLMVLYAACADGVESRCSSVPTGESLGQLLLVLLGCPVRPLACGHLVRTSGCEQGQLHRRPLRMLPPEVRGCRPPVVPLRTLCKLLQEEVVPRLTQQATYDVGQDHLMSTGEATHRSEGRSCVLLACNREEAHCRLQRLSELRIPRRKHRGDILELAPGVGRGLLAGGNCARSSNRRWREEAVAVGFSDHESTLQLAPIDVGVNQPAGPPCGHPEGCSLLEVGSGAQRIHVIAAELRPELAADRRRDADGTLPLAGLCHEAAVLLQVTDPQHDLSSLQQALLLLPGHANGRTCRGQL